MSEPPEGSLAGLRVCLLTDQDLDQDPFPPGDWPCDPRPFLPQAEWSVATLEKARAVEQVVRLAGQGFDLFFNLCDGAWDEPRPGLEVVRTLERLGRPFTGADSAFYEPSREAMKRVCRAWGVETPAYSLVQGPEEVHRALDLLDFPMIVKHPSSYASTGMTRDSRVESADALRRQVRRMTDAYGGALVEEFVEGVEATVLVSEDPTGDAPTAYTPVRYRFPEGESFKHYDLKWVEFEGLRARPVEDPALADGLRNDAVRFFTGIRGTGYGRCDVRIDREGRRFMLEINPNCGLYYPPSAPASADLILHSDPAGHEGFTRRVVRAALARHARRRRPWEVRPRPGGDHGLFATRDLTPGNTILRFEERPHHLVTRTRVDACWNERKRRWFGAYAWPLTDEVWVMWSDDPEEWRPVNHACDPSAWVEGLDVVARRPLEAGDEITLDYATFMNEAMPPFSCACGSDTCRGTIRGDDHLQDFVARYGHHVSDYVARKRGMR